MPAGLSSSPDVSNAAAAAATSLPRIRATGKFLEAGSEKCFLHGATYGPFGPAGLNGGLPEPATAARDLDAMKAWGANVLRLYHPPPEWFIDLCTARQLRLVVSIPWADHVDFLRHKASQRAVLEHVRTTAAHLAGSSTVAVLLVGNEIPCTLVRWLGAAKVLRFVEALIDAARAAAPDTLIGYANYPGTEYLQPRNAGFIGFNVYLEERSIFRKYLARLQNIAGDRPLLITEFGVDALSHGPERQAEILKWQSEECHSMGIAGNLLFSWTDEWFRGGSVVTGWAFGLTDANRNPRPARTALEGGPRLPGSLIPHPAPRFSVIVCTRNGSATLTACLASLGRLHYPNYEVILVDDGSTDRVREIAWEFPKISYLRQEAAGLSIARNAGAAAASGEIFAYTDDDCQADPDWLIYLSQALTDPAIVAVGGPNIPPPPRTLTQACVIAAPGGPAHVLLTDQTAEHIPGCNLAVRRSAFDKIGGFLPQYHAAGDDVDFCWRLLAAGGKIAFAPAAWVWHDRRTTVRAFLRQQQGYGKAEALLMVRHSRRFGQMGGARWQGVVYQPAMLRLFHEAGRIYSGVFGYAPFQAIYRPNLIEAGGILTGFPWWLLLTAVAASALWFPPARWIALAMLLATMAYTARRAWILRPDRPWPALRGFLLLWLLTIAQPVVRGWSRFIWNIRLGSAPRGPWWPLLTLPGLTAFSAKPITELAFWSNRGTGRDELLAGLTKDLDRSGKMALTGDGWQDWDLEAHVSTWWKIRLITLTEYHAAPGRLTRIRLGSKVTWAWMALQVIVAALCASLVPWKNIHPLWAVGLFFVWSILLEMIHHRTITRAAALTAATAARHGMVPWLPRPIPTANDEKGDYP